MDISEIAQMLSTIAEWQLSQAELGRLAGVGKTAVFDLEHQKETIRFDDPKDSRSSEYHRKTWKPSIFDG